MADMSALQDQLKNLRDRAVELASTVLSLDTVLTEEANQLNREDDASRLRALFKAITEDLERVKWSESSARYGHSRVNFVVSLAELGLSATAMVSKNERLSTISRHLLENSRGKERPFGNVLVSIGPKGIPDEVRAVSISEKARDSNRPESEVMNELLKGGYLLFSEKEFSLLIDKLVEGVLQGQMCLPISRQTLSGMKVSSEPGLRIKKIE